MAGLDFPRLNQDTPETIVVDYLQRGARDIQEKYALQWDEVNRRGAALGQRKADEMFQEIDMRARQELQGLQQSAEERLEQLARVDRLAQQAGFDPYEAKMRMVVSPEEAAALFPREQKERPFTLQELQSYETQLKRDAPDFITVPSQRIPEKFKFEKAPWWWPLREQEKRTGPVRMVWDPNINPTRDKETGMWIVGDYRPATQEDIQKKFFYDERLAEVAAFKKELLGQPDFATRIRGAMLKTKRDPVHDSLTTRVRKSAGMDKPEPRTPQQTAPKRQAIQPPAEHPDAVWNPEHKMWTIIKDGRLVGIK